MLFLKKMNFENFEKILKDNRKRDMPDEGVNFE